MLRWGIKNKSPDTRQSATALAHVDEEAGGKQTPGDFTGAVEHPDWVEPNGNCPTRDSCELRLRRTSRTSSPDKKWEHRVR